MEFPIPSEEQVREFERRFNVRMPEEYVAFLGVNQEIRQEWMQFSYAHPTRGVLSTLVKVLFGLNDENHPSDVRWHLNLLGNRIPKQYLPIGATPGGDLILLCLATVNYGQIFRWDHENEDTEMPFDNLHFLSDSFTNFVENLSEVDF